MNMKKAWTKRIPAWGGRRVFPSALCVALAALLLLTGTGASRSLSGAAIPAPDSAQPLLMAALEGDVLLVLSEDDGGRILRLNGATGRVKASLTLEERPIWAGLLGDELNILLAGEEQCSLTSRGVDNFSLAEEKWLPFGENRLLQFACLPDGGFCWVLSQSRGSLHLVTREGESQLSFPGEICFLSLSGTDLAVGTQTSLFFPSGGAPGEGIPCSAPVEQALGEGLFRDVDGQFLRLEEGRLLPQFRWEEPIWSGLTLCRDEAGEGSFLLPDGASGLRRVQNNGEKLEYYPLEGRPLAVCSLGALTAGEDGLRYAALPAPGEEEPPLSGEPVPDSPDPAPESSPEPESSPAPDEEPPREAQAPVRLEGDFILIEEGMTAAQLRQLFVPDTCDLRDRAGQSVFSGRLGSGMTANRWTLVLPGDCDGSGSVSRNDLRQAAQMLYREQRGKADLEPALRRAADLNADGSLTTADLVLLRDMLDAPES